ncbi:hypothetical protein CDAR_562571 [Caerostris darwini]|uniref:Uncharacterized protein n=1 Tax=Caerostris darwini TaxID=1538125 RepID=A0AAV4X9B9_9ARAC|nr:hypothetical protein CDAR_562571 [Caerostris darwini]
MHFRPENNFRFRRDVVQLSYKSMRFRVTDEHIPFLFVAGFFFPKLEKIIGCGITAAVKTTDFASSISFTENSDGGCISSILRRRIASSIHTFPRVKY